MGFQGLGLCQRIRGCPEIVAQTIDLCSAPMVQSLRGRGLKAARKAAAGQPGSYARCVGRKDEACIFSIQDAGGAAAAQARSSRCNLCCAENLGRCLSSARGKGLLTCALAFYKENDFNAFSQACARIAALASEEALDRCLQRLRRREKKPTKEHLIALIVEGQGQGP